MLRLGLVIALSWGALALGAEDAKDASALTVSDKLPRITQHSNQDGLEVIVGDGIVLRAQVVGATSSLWVTKSQTICKGESCTISTAGWSLGVHNIVFVARNAIGSQSVTFRLRVKSKQVGRAPTKLTPPMTEAGEVESLGSGDFHIRARRGLSFVYQKDNRIQILGSLPRKLEWNERFRSSGGVLQFGKANEEEHSLLTGSYARLGMRGERRVIDLEDGMVRLRQVSEAVPTWSMVAGDWLQVDGDRKADIIVNLGKHAKDKTMPVTRIVALRGQARVSYKKPIVKKDTQPALTAHEDKKTEVVEEMQQLIVPAGTTVILDFTNEEQPVLRLPPNNLVEKVMTATTPSYLDPVTWVKGDGKRKVDPEDDEEEVSADVHVLREAQQPAKLDAALTLARVAMAERDAILVLELLLPLHEAQKDSYELAFLLGRAYRQLAIYEQAYLFLQTAREIESENSDPLFQLGLLATEFGKWRQARDWFDQASARNHSDVQAVLYYGGYARHRLGVAHKSRELLHRSLWEETDPVLGDAARELLKHIEDEKSWAVKTHFSLLYDSNVLSKPASVAAPSDVSGSSGTALGFDLGISSVYLKSESGYFGAGFDFGYVGWLAEGLKAVDTALQKIHTDFGLRSGDSFSMDGQIYIGTYVVGGQRANDGMGLAVTMALPGMVFEPELIWDISMWVDPMPNRDDVLDPFLWEIVVPSDRSARRLKYGLGGLLHRGAASELRSRMVLTQHRHASALITIEDYDETHLGMDYDVRYSNRIRLSALGNLSLRTFGKAPDGRKDTVFHLKGETRYYQTPFLSFDGGLGLWNQSSSRSANKFTKFLFTTGVGLEM